MSKKQVSKKKHIYFKNFNLAHDDFEGFQGGHAMLVDSDGVIAWVGKTQDRPKDLKIQHEIDLKKKNILPSFIECHTHTVFAGSRAAEFEERLKGVSYLEIAQRGGGILSTVRHTRQQTAAQLLKQSQKRVNEFLRQGVSTLEIKSGYSLDLKNEIKMLEVAQKIKGPQIVTTFLGAHAKPTEFDSYSDYLNYLAKQVLPVVKKKKIANRVDIFIEKNFFEVAEARSFLKTAQEMGFHLTIHANQLSDSGGAQLALELEALSADHVIHLSSSTIQNFSNSKTVAVLLPTADLYMKCAYPPARQLIDAGATVALATDFNPGSCPSQDLMLVGLLARLEMKMTLPEVFKAYTVNAAKALGIDHEQGRLKAGQLANFICTEADLTDFFYSAGFVPEHDLFIRGKRISRL